MQISKAQRPTPSHLRALLCGLAVWIGATAPATLSAQGSLTEDFHANAVIDFAFQKGRQKSMLGMNHGALPTPDEPDRTIPAFSEFIDPLDFQIWSSGASLTRNGFLGMVRGTHPNTRSFLRLGGGLVKRCPYEAPLTRPYEAPEKYREYVRCATEWARDNGVDVIDVWNEPNLSTFSGPEDGSRTEREAYFETFKIAHETILEVWPDAVIAGPTLGKIDQEVWLQEFMDFCERERLEVPVLTWHEIGTRARADTFAALEGKLRKARRDYINSPDYPHVGVQEIVINEFVSDRYHDIPASNLAVMYYLEEGGADAAARTCWKQVPGSTCFEWTLGGLVTPPDEDGVQHKKALWWVMRYYDKSLGNRAEFTSDLENLVGMANPNQLLFGLYEETDFTEQTGRKTLTLDVALENLDQIDWLTEEMKSIQVVKREILYDDPEAAMPRVPVRSRKTVSIKTAADGSRRASFSSKMDVHSVLVFELKPVTDEPLTAAESTVIRGRGKKAKEPRRIDPIERPTLPTIDPDAARAIEIEERFERKEKSDRR